MMNEMEEKKDPDLAVETPEPEKKKHSPLHIAAIVGAGLVFVFILAFNYFNNAADGTVFLNTIGNTSDFFYFEITPASWAFSIWGVIYAWQFAFFVYAISTIFRSTPHGPAYLSPPPVPLPVYFIYMLNMVINLAWLFAFDRRIVGLSLALLLAIPVTIGLMMGFCFWRTTENIAYYKSINRRWEMILLNIFVHNAFAIYLGWTVCASLLNFGFALIYSASNVAQETAGIITLTFLFLMILVFVPLELTVFDKHLRYVVMHYLGPIMALSASIDKQSGTPPTAHIPSGVNRTYAIVILSVLLVLVAVRIVAIIVRAWLHPLYYEKNKNSVEDLRGFENEQK